MPGKHALRVLGKTKCPNSQSVIAYARRIEHLVQVQQKPVLGGPKDNHDAARWGSHMTWAQAAERYGVAIDCSGVFVIYWSLALHLPSREATRHLNSWPILTYENDRGFGLIAKGRKNASSVHYKRCVVHQNQAKWAFRTRWRQTMEYKMT